MLKGVNNFILKKSRFIQFSNILILGVQSKKFKLEPIITQFIDACMRQETKID